MGAHLVTRRPPPELAPFVSAIHDYATPGATALEIQPASLDVPVIVCLAGGFRIAFDRLPGPDDRIASFVSGLHPGTVAIDSEAGAACVQVNFTPLGARLALRQPMDAFAGRLVPLDDLAHGPLPDRLADCRSAAGRLAIAEAWAVERVAAGRAEETAEARATAAALRLLHRTHGRVRVETLADRLGWTRKRLADRFRADFGLTPKPLARILRFRRAEALAAAAAARPDWADIAAACGYADQPHLVREYRRLAGHTPTA
jgi:AraC-like DNA-binding protein